VTGTYDFLRAFSILVVVFGHWFIALIWREGGEIGVHNAIGVTRGLWLITWLFQVMPVFFFVGGFSNLKTYEAMRARGESVSDFWRVRFERLLKPTAVFVGIWLAIQAGLYLVDAGGTGIIRGGMLPFGPLWFLLVYLGVILLTPPAVLLHRRAQVFVPAVMVAVVVMMDVLRFAFGVPKLAGESGRGLAVRPPDRLLLRRRLAGAHRPFWAGDDRACRCRRARRPHEH
jgi:peptidoglycan/LPS O-acetylase OafA/YrhL